MYRDDTTYAPFLLTETSPGKYSLLLTDNKMGPAAAPIAAADREPNGYAWTDIASHLVATEAPALAGRFGFDPEAGMFCAYGTDLEGLQALAAIVSRVFHDHPALAAAAKAAPWEWD